MATFTSTSGSYTTTLTVNQTSQDIASNTSVLTYSLTLTKNSGWGLYNGDPCPWSITINGSTVSGTFTYNFQNYSSLTLKGNTTISVAHNSDGTKTVACSASVNMDNEPYVYVMKPSGDLALTTIPRASDISLSVSSFSITSSSGNAFSWSITAKSSSFYNRLRYSIGNKSNITSNKGQGNSSGYFTNQELLSALPTSTSGSLTVYCDTYSDSGYTNLIGTKSVVITVSVNTANIKPSVSLGNIGLNSTKISGYAVAGYSKVQSAWTTTNSSGASSVTTYLSTSHGTLGTTSSTSTSGTTVSGYIPSSSANYTLTISAYAKDSRGATSSTVSKSITVYGYTPPTANLTAYRVASSGSTAEDGAGTFAYVAFSGAVSSSVNSRNTLQSVSCSYSGSISGTIAGSTSATTSRWLSLTDTQTVTFTVTATDKVTSSTSVKTISTASYPLDLYDDGNGNVGVGLGTVAVAGEVRSPLTTRVATNDGNTQLVVGSPNKSTGRTYSYVRSGGGSLYFGAGEKDGTYVAWCDVLNQAGSGKEILTVNQNLDVNFVGNASTATNATNATNYNVIVNDPTSGTWFRPVFVTNSSGNLPGYNNNGLMYNCMQGTSSAVGNCYLRVGNETGQGTAGNKRGILRLYSNTTYCTDLLAPTGQSANHFNVFLPNGNGNLEAKTALYALNILGGNETTVTGVKGTYQRLRVYAKASGSTFTVWEVDVNQITTSANKFSHSVPIYASDVGDWYLTIYDLKLTQSGNDVKVYFDCYNKRIGTSGQSTQNNNSNYAIYKIEGIV